MFLFYELTCFLLFGMFASAAFRRLEKKSSQNRLPIKPVLTQPNKEVVDDG